jgi:hypothetical protein
MYPTEERVKHLETQVGSIIDPDYYGHSIEDEVLHGVIIDVVYNASGAPDAHIKVAPFEPEALRTNGDILFEQINVHPMTDIETDPSLTQYEKVYALNIYPELYKLYFKVGQVVKYWRYSGTTVFSPLIRGSYVTLVEDLRFYARLTFNATITAGGISFSKYNWTAVVNDPTQATTDLKWQNYSPSTLGVAFNTCDFDSIGTGGTALNNVIVKLTPFLNKTVTASPYVEYWFTQGAVGQSLPPPTAQHQVLTAPTVPGPWVPGYVRAHA